MREQTAFYRRLAMGAAMGALMLGLAAHARAAQTGHAWAWGNNSYGQLGDGTNIERNVPVQVLGYRGGGFLDEVRSVDGGSGHSVAKRRTDYNPHVYSMSSVLAWGLNSDGQLGDDSTSTSYFPTSAPGATANTSSFPLTAPDVDAVSAGYYHTLYADFLGAPASWGRNSSGELGKWYFSPYNEYASMVALPNGGITAVSGGKSHSLALRVDGTVFAWGDNSSGQLGNGSLVGGFPSPTADSDRPIQVGGRIGRRVVPLSQVKAIAAGGDFSLALRQDGTVWAWGYNGDGELGTGTTSNSSVPVQVSGLTDVVAIGAGDRHGLAVKSDGTVWAWGYNGFGQLGDGTLASRSLPVQVVGLTGVTVVAGGGYHSLALMADGTVRAWGFNFYGQLGDGTNTNRATPVQVVGMDGVFAIGAGTLHSLAVRP